MNYRTKLLGSVFLFLITLLLSSCKEEDGNSASINAAADVVNVAADSTTNTIRTVAGFESGLRRLAHIDDTLALAGLGNVWITYGSGSVEGSAEGLLANCKGVAGRRDCDVYGTVTYKTPGTYSYTVSYTPSGLFADRVTLHGKAIVEAPGDFVIVSIGDSVASGEGSPMYPWIGSHEGPYWNDTPSNYDITDVNGCHRSTYAGPVMAVNKIKQTNNVTFVHIACSGASFGNAVAGEKDSEKYRYGNLDKINLQVDWVRERLPRIDVLILSGGANNVYGGFSKVVEKCLLNNVTKPCSEDQAFADSLKSSIDGLKGPAGKYADLQRLIQAGEYDKIPSVVAITEYFDPTRDAKGDFPSAAVSVSCGLGAISPKEWEFLYNNMVVPLNDAVREGAGDNQWVHVAGIADAFRTHGYCASVLLGDISGRSWVVKAPESLSNQRDIAGTAHPDINGQYVYRDHIYTEVVQANPPRTTARATTAGQPYTFGTWTPDDVEVTLSVKNPIKEAGVRETYFTVDEPQCNVNTVDVGACLPYYGPITITESGRHTVSFFSYNQFGAPETRVKPVEVLIDKEPPVMTCDAVPDELWPPNKRMVGITVSVTAVDEVSGPADYFLVDIQDSAGNVSEGVQDFDIGTSDTEGYVLSDRTGYGGNRFYTLTYQSEDAVGNVGTCDAVVIVPHDQGNN